ncbi:phosphoadenosine phosphosulfate reductase [Jannaschia sp. W003]|uniref:phosphoadenosine phosphosulfate reductase n=1 Tax=Jannaschia sp. W003 TaxID=2867012 RepID=UPI0021A82EDD|nr:phosphoadenosine phosphosulfate reductase [Jannaschia sp. W003]UWQ20367.1 phosphoadenosine phosphosulfate reductase [Jannaschia sp. W003]
MAEDSAGADGGGTTTDPLMRRLVETARDGGWLRDVGDRHMAHHRPGGATLLVGFEELETARERDEPAPWTARLAAKRGYATLTILADGRTWYRDPALEALFDELTDEGFFDEFDTVIFAGGGAEGYAASAYSVAAPGATVFAVQPLATLDRALTPWERRFRSAWALAWGPRYAYAPDLVGGAERVYVVSDPTETFDAMHASLFRGPHVMHLPATHAGPEIWQRLETIGILDRLVAGAESGALTPLRFAQLWRGRRRDRAWLGGMLRKLDRRGRPWLTGLFARYVADRHDSAPARRRLADARARLCEEGRALPGEEPPAEPVREAG